MAKHLITECPECGDDDIERVQGDVLECCTCGHDLGTPDFSRFLGIAGPGPTTDEIMAITRDDD
ncbi:hypothetical protein GAY33_19160 [Azospirillum brasilense]|uniref:hypothetical protein n=1 Tax=Azospirillum argentinense TaxID=2970906 RepID=UPI00190E6792|nr:hypothetical protein [Azospirillum argentinense]MBK3801310.1 hypothetical protein [Azospirillum argentinense]